MLNVASLKCAWTVLSKFQANYDDGALATETKGGTEGFNWKPCLRVCFKVHVPQFSDPFTKLALPI